MRSVALERQGVAVTDLGGYCGGLDISPVFAIIILSAAAILISGLKQLPV